MSARMPAQIIVVKALFELGEQVPARRQHEHLTNVVALLQSAMPGVHPLTQGHAITQLRRVRKALDALKDAPDHVQEKFAWSLISDELRSIGKRMKKHCWDVPENFYQEAS